MTGPLAAHEVQEAELYWILQVQQETFAQDREAISNSQLVVGTSRLLRLQPFLDSAGVIRVGGRLHCLQSPFEVRHLIILPGKHDLTRLLILATHERLLQAGTEATLAEIRQRYWIFRGCQTVKKALHQYLPCRRRRLTPETAPTAPFPHDRITETSPFSVVGVDFCGPLYCRTNDPYKVKAYVAVFSCGVRRALQLELTTGMTAPSFFLAFRRSIARRGIPATVYSGNALAFKHCAKSFHSLNDATLQDFCSGQRIVWKFYVEKAPWSGGWWGRVIRITKETLRRALGRNSLTAEELATVLCEVEAVINSRPLTYVTTNADGPHPITPAHSWLGKPNTCLPQNLGPFQPSSTSSELTSRWRHRHNVTKRLWRRWRDEYLLILRSAHEAPLHPLHHLAVGDVVVVHDEGYAPTFWRLGRVARLLPGRGGIARTCVLLLSTTQEMRRPIQRLYFLEAYP